MPHQVSQFTLALGEKKTLGPLAFNPASIGIDNVAPFDVHLLDGLFGWGRRFHVGVMVSSPTSLRTSSLNVSALDTFPGDVPPPSASMSVAYITVYEDFQPPSPGVSILSASNQTVNIQSNPSGAGTILLVAGVPNQNIYGVQLALSAQAATQVNVDLEDTSGAAVTTFTTGAPATTWISFPAVDYNNAILTTSSGLGIRLNVSGACGVRGCFIYNQL